MRKYLTMAVLVALFGALLVPALTDGAAFGAEKPAVALKAGVLTGKVTDETGKTLAAAEVRFLDKSDKVVAKVVTDDKGAFATKKLAEGTYTLALDKTQFAIVLKKDAKASKLVVIDRSKPAYAAAAAAPATVGGMTAGTLLAVGGGTAIVLGTGVIVYDNVSDDDDDDRVSP